MNESIQHTRAVFKREWAAYFNSPIAAVFMMIFLALAGFLTFSVSRFFEAGQADLRGFFIWHPWLFLILVPAVAMRLWAEEKRSGTMELLFTLSVTPAQALAGKFLAAWLFLALTIGLTFPIVITTAWLGNPDPGPIAAGYLGSILLAGTYLTLGLFTSALTRNQVISFILAVVLGFFMMLSGLPPVTNLFAQWAPEWLVEGLAACSFLSHFETMQRGVIDARDLLYFAGVTTFMLLLTNYTLNIHRDR